MKSARAALLVLFAAACAERAPSAPDPAPAEVAAEAIGDPARGRELLARFECHRCHEGTGLDAPPLDRQCVGCHRAVLDGSFDAPRDSLERWRGRLHSLNHAPSLAGLAGHLRRDWIARFLLRPHDLRPGLEATMPRLALSDAEAADLAAALTDGAPGEPAHEAAPGDVELGVRLIAERGCLSCHAFTGLAGARAPQAASAAITLAPDLRFTRERMHRAALLAWLRDPSAARPGTLMPAPSLSDEERRAVADAILRAPLAPAPTAEVPERLPLLDRRVRYEEVAERVFRSSCWHCHADPDFAHGDGGAGNTGGFGYPGRGVDLHDYAGVSSGYLDHDGERRSLFALDGDAPRLVRVLMARHHEEAGAPVEGITGMPLGLPPLPLEDIQLLETWIAQGRPL